MFEKISGEGNRFCKFSQIYSDESKFKILGCNEWKVKVSDIQYFQYWWHYG